MATRPASQPVDDWQTVPPPADDWQAVPRGTVSSAQLPPNTANDAFKAGVYSKMLNLDPGTAYKNTEEIEKQLHAIGGNYNDGKIDDSLANDIKAGWENSIVGLSGRKTLPEEIRNPGMVDRFVSSISQLVGDAPAMFAGGLIGGAAGSEVPVVGNVIGAGAGAFALPAAGREALIQGIKHGDVQNFSDILRRTASIAWAGTKGAVTGAITTATGDLPVGSFIGKSGLATAAVKGAYQATALTTTADLLEGKLPSKKDFAGNAALILPLNLITHGMAMGKPETNEALMDVYQKSGKTPAESNLTLNAQPPVKPEMPEGLRPAINLGETTVDGDTTENHAELATRVTGRKPVSMEELEAEPEKADKVLENPTVHEQSVIDRAWQIKKDAVDRGDVETPEDGEKPQTIEDLYDRGAMKSGRGFVAPDGKFLSRTEARKWTKDNEPDVHQMWLDGVGGDKQAEMHSEDYSTARYRVQARSVAEGDPTIANVSPENAARLAAAREDLNKIKAGDACKGIWKRSSADAVRRPERYENCRDNSVARQPAENHPRLPRSGSTLDPARL